MSNEIQEYMPENGINHKKITPLWPQANSEAESFKKPLIKGIHYAKVVGQQWKKHLYRYKRTLFYKCIFPYRSDL